MDDALTAQIDQQKESRGRAAAFIWIGIGIYLFSSTPQAHFFSWQAVVFFVVGMFVAAVVFGGVSYAVHRALIQYYGGIRPHETGRRLAFAVVATVLKVAPYVANVLAAWWAFGRLLGV